MTHQLILTNEQGIALYNWLSNLKLDRAKNRNRWKFLHVIEDAVLDYEEKQTDIKTKADQSTQASALHQGDQKLSVEQKTAKQKESNEYIKTLQKEVKNLQKTKNTFTFNDREIFEEAKVFFKDVSNPKVDESKPTDPAKDWLAGYDGRIYSEIQEAFLFAKEIEDKKK